VTGDESQNLAPVSTPAFDLVLHVAADSSTHIAADWWRVENGHPPAVRTGAALRALLQSYLL
jgi:hypothetical protein